MKTKLTLHTKMTGEIFLDIVIDNVKFAEISMGSSPKDARTRAKKFKDAMKEHNDDIIDQIT